MKAYNLPAAALPAIRINRTNSSGGKNRQSRFKQNLKKRRNKKSETDPEPLNRSKLSEEIERVSGYGRRHGVDDRRSPDKSKRNRSIDIRI
jgi:hypothetical protein